MKLVLVSLAVFALATASPFYGRPKATYGLQEDLNDFAKLIPVNEIASIGLEYLMNDVEVQEVFEYVQSDDFKQLVQDVEAEKEYIKFLDYLQASGLDVYAAVNKLHEFLGLPPLNSFMRSMARRGQGVRGLIDDIKAILPLDKIKALYYEKLQSSTEFAALVERMRSEEIKNTVKEMIKNPRLQEIVQKGKEHGIDVKMVIDILNKIFGWGLEETRSAVTYGLQEDLNDFAKLIPVNEIASIGLEYLMNDVEVQEVFEYVQSDDFKQLVQDVEAEKEYIKFLDYLQASGLDVYAAVNKLHDFLGLPPLNSFMRSMARRGQGVRGLIDDIKAILPLDKIKALYYEKLQSSTEFAALVERMRSEEIKNTVKEMIKNPRLQEIVQKGKEHGIDVKMVIDILNKIFGWGLEETRSAVTYGLQEDLNDFAKLIPVNEIAAIGLEYLMNDVEVQEVFEYVQSDDFKQLVQDVEAEKEYIKFLDYLQASGLDVYAAVNKLHDFLGLPPLNSYMRSMARRGQGVRGLIDDIKAILPLDKIKALYYEKLQSSTEFAALVERMRSDEIKNTVKEMIKNPRLQEIVQKGKEHGIDVKMVIDILNKIFGWGLEETRSAVTYGLQEDLNDFAKLIPVNEIASIGLEYLMNDVEVQEVFEYVQSDDFKQLVQDVEAEKEYIKFLDYLQASGLDVYAAVNKLHEFLGLPPLNSFMRSMARRGQGVRGLIDDIKAILPLNKIKALYYEKLQSSTEFAALVERMRSEEIKNTVKEMIKNPRLQEIVQKGKEHGIDVKMVIDILNKIFGWGLEETYSRFVTYNLKDDLNDFLALIPTKEIMNVALDYVFNDEEVQLVIEYIQSQESIDLILDVESIPQFSTMMKYFEDSGLEVYKALNLLHEFLGIPPFSGYNLRMPRKGTGVRGLIDDIEALIPMDKIEAMYNDKLTSSPDFAAFVAKMRGDEIKGTVQELVKDPKVIAFIEKAKEHKVDVNLVFDILNKLFGWGL